MRLNIPVPENQISATKFVESIKGLDNREREDAALEALLAGHVPTHMRETVTVTLTFRSTDGLGHVLDIDVLPNYLSIGTDDDFVNMPLWPITAQKVCDAWDCSLPTTKIVDLLFNAANSRLAPLPWGPPYDASMQSTERIVEHNRRIEAQIASSLKPVSRVKLLSGHKKDVVITNRLESFPDRVAIYGWHQLNGRPIQPLYLGHENSYCDYSHGIRLVSNDCVLDDQYTRLSSIMTDPNTCVAVSHEGIMKVLRQP